MVNIKNMNINDINVSVAMTTCNGESFLVEQLDSIVNQSRKPNEIIICDDKSDDDTLKLLNDYVKNNKLIKDNNIKVKIFENEERLGFNKNFQKSILNTTGDIIFLSDQDDVWDKYKIEKHLQIHKDTGKQFVGSEFLITDEKLNIIGNADKKDKDGIVQVKLIDMMKYSFYGMCTSMVRDEYFDIMVSKLGDDRIFIYDKYLSMYYLLRDEMIFYEKPLSYHRIYENNAVGTYKKMAPKGDMQDRVNVAKKELELADYLIALSEDDLPCIKKGVAAKEFQKIYNFRKERYDLLSSKYNKVNKYGILDRIKFLIQNKSVYHNKKVLLGDMYFLFKVISVV